MHCMNYILSFDRYFCRSKNTKLIREESFFFFFSLNFDLFVARKHDARFLVSDVTIQYGHGAQNLESSRILNENTLRNMLATLQKQKIKRTSKNGQRVFVIPALLLLASPR